MQERKEEAMRGTEEQTERGGQGLRRRGRTRDTEEEMGGRKEEELIV